MNTKQIKLEATANVQLSAAGADGKPAGQPSFTMDAYTGGVLSIVSVSPLGDFTVGEQEADAPIAIVEGAADGFNISFGPALSGVGGQAGHVVVVELVKRLAHGAGPVHGHHGEGVVEGAVHGDPVGPQTSQRRDGDPAQAAERRAVVTRGHRTTKGARAKAQGLFEGVAGEGLAQTLVEFVAQPNCGVAVGRGAFPMGPTNGFDHVGRAAQ